MNLSIIRTERIDAEAGLPLAAEGISHDQRLSSVKNPRVSSRGSKSAEVNSNFWQAESGPIAFDGNRGIAVRVEHHTLKFILNLAMVL